LTEVRLNDVQGKSAGNIDVVLVSYDTNGRVLDFGALEVQAVYISGNVRAPFEHYMQDPLSRHDMDWTSEPNYPRPDYLSSSRKRLAPQLLFKGGILHTWGKRVAVALTKEFFATLPPLKTSSKESAEIAWLLYDLVPQPDGDDLSQLQLKKIDELYTDFAPTLATITTARPGKIEDFVKLLQGKLDEKFETPPDTKPLNKAF
jgi:hypothetical protein